VVAGRRHFVSHLGRNDPCIKQKHSDSANLRQRQNFNQKWSEILVGIFGLIQIRMSVGSVSKCRGCIILSASVILPSMVQIGRWLYEKHYQMSKNPLFCNGEENEKMIRNPHALPDHHQKSITSRGSFTCCPCLPSLVDVRIRVHQLSCLQNDRTNSHSLRLVDGLHAVCAQWSGGKQDWKPLRNI